MLANVYSYRVMVKSITCCVRGRRVISNLVTYGHANVNELLWNYKFIINFTENQGCRYSLYYWTEIFSFFGVEITR